MSEEEIRKLSLSFFIKSGALLLVWTLLSWLAADAIQKSHTRALIHAETAALDNLVSNTAQSIDFGLDYLHGIPALVAGDELVQPAMLRFSSSTPSKVPVEKRKAMWVRDSLLKDINGYLDQVSSSLGADVVWITNAAGDCIASSNADMPESFVGTNYADREYFQLAQSGKLGRQYAMGRKTNIPGLYFSAPITINGRFAGVAVAKIDLPRLQHWVNQTDAFILDEHGVIILANDPALEMRALPGADIAQVPEAERMARYKRTEFPQLEIPPWDAEIFPHYAASIGKLNLC